MRQVGVRLEEDLIKELKFYSYENKISMQEAIKRALQLMLNDKNAVCEKS